MPDLVPVRDIAKFGINTDTDAYDLPIGSWSFGVNARFRNNKVTRGPVFRSVISLDTVSPRHIVGFTPTAGTDQTFVGYLNGTIKLVSPSAQTDATLSGYVPSSAEATWSSAHLQDLIYINREDRVPWYRAAGASLFSAIPAWTSNWRAKIIRASNSTLMAFNVTLGAVSYPSGVLTSGFASAGVAPASWDYTTPGTNATFNQLAEMEGGIVDACALHNDMWIYGANEAWRYVFSNDSDVWVNKKVFDNRGVISANCVVEVLGRNYVFGVDDIWMHDGITAASIADGRVREFIFGAIDLSKANRCFVTHNPQLKEIHFCFISGDQRTKFLPYDASGFDGCNRQAVYNYAFNHWTFDDLPYVYSASRCNMDVVTTYASVTSTYASTGATYQDQSGSAKKPLCYVGEAQSSLGLGTKLYAFDVYGTGSIAPFTVDANATGGMYLERDGIDLDELAVDLRGYKVLNSIYPQGRLGDTAAALEFTVGGADYFTSAPTLSGAQTYDGDTLYKLDFGIPGRYLTMQIEQTDYKEVTLTGFDLDLSVNGEF